MQVLKPSRLGILLNTVPVPPRRYAVITTLVYFDLRNPDLLLSEQAMWTMVGEQLGDQILDMGVPKIRGEVLVHGQACAPGGQPVAGMRVGVRLGGLRKSVAVIGDRYWSIAPGGAETHVSEPVPFTHMPLTWDRAFGGPGCDRNPEGRGHDALDRLKAGESVLLPNLEDPARPIGTPTDTPEPAGLGPIPLTHPGRMARAGTRYDDDWFANRFPALATDAEWTLYNDAAADQWADGFFQPGMPFILEGFHPDHPRLEGALPRVQGRAFVTRRDSRGLIPVQQRIDTVWLFPTVLKGILLFRGALTVDRDIEELQTVMLACEAEDTPRPDNHYARVFRRRTDPETAAAAAVEDAQLMAPSDPETLARIAQARADAEAQRAADQAGREQAMAVLSRDEPAGPEIPEPELPDPAAMPEEAREKVAAARAEAEAAMTAPPPEPPDLPDLPEIPILTEEELEAGEADLALVIDAIKEIDRQATAMMAKLAAAPEPEIDLPPLPDLPEAVRAHMSEAEQEQWSRAATGADPEHNEAKALAEAVARFKGAPVDGGTPVPVPDLPDLSDQARATLAERNPEALAEWDATRARAAEAQQAEDIETPAAVPMAVRQAGPEPLVPAAPLAPESAVELGRLVRAALAAGESLAGRDMAGADLSGLDLSGQNLAGAGLERAVLARARLVGCGLAGAVLTGADLDGADLSGADLSGANLAATTGRKPLLRRARLTDGRLIGARLPGADFHGAYLENMVIMGADLATSHWRHATLKNVTFLETILTDSLWWEIRSRGCLWVDSALDRADFTGANLQQAVLPDLAAEGFRLVGARLDQVALTGARLPALAAASLKARDSNLHGAELAGADFENGQLIGCDLGQACLRGARFAGASLKAAILVKADLEEADLRGADLNAALLSGARLVRTDLRQANLYEAETLDALVRDVQVADAHLAGSKWEVVAP